MCIHVDVKVALCSLLSISLLCWWYSSTHRRGMPAVQLHCDTQLLPTAICALRQRQPPLPGARTLQVLSGGCPTCVLVAYWRHFTHFEMDRVVCCKYATGKQEDTHLCALMVCSQACAAWQCRPLAHTTKGYARMPAKHSLTVVPVSITVQECEIVQALFKNTLTFLNSNADRHNCQIVLCKHSGIALGSVCSQCKNAGLAW